MFVEPVKGFEPLSTEYKSVILPIKLYRQLMELMDGLEPSSAHYECVILLLNYTGGFKKKVSAIGSFIRAHCVVLLCGD